MIRKHHILMSALGAALSAGATAFERAFEAIETKFHLRHAHTEQVCTFDTPEAAHNFLASTAAEDRDNWLPHDTTALGPSTGTVVSVDLAQLRTELKAEAAAEDAQAAPAGTEIPAATEQQATNSATA